MSAKSDFPNNPSAPVSWGELVDKITILGKQTRLASPKALANVRCELAALASAAEAHCKNADLARIKAELRLVSETLWEIEDRIRAKEADSTRNSSSWRDPCISRTTRGPGSKARSTG
jgi:hypothetical protein